MTQCMMWTLCMAHVKCLQHLEMSRVLRKPAFCICENKDADQLRGNREADQRLGFAIRIVQFLFYLKPKFNSCSHLLWLYSPVCVGPGRRPRKPVFSQRGSNINEKYVMPGKYKLQLMLAVNEGGYIASISCTRSHLIK